MKQNEASNPDSLAAQIRGLRLAYGLSQAKLAERLGVSRVTVSNWERGIAVPTSRVIKRRIQQELELQRGSNGKREDAIGQPGGADRRAVKGASGVQAD
ncbi:MAG: helix-turn-helix transcriptional regulator [Candidatus Thermoplasmatota archaeon]|nr:helix-turn-helix transcriptional regulator [Candidatus Thermoplasmatota archaeon]